MSTQKRIHLRQMLVGPMANYVYIVGDPETRKAAVVDPAWNIDSIIDAVRQDGYEIDKVLITHYHPDHLGGDLMGHSIEGAAELVARVPAKVYVNRHEAYGVQKVSGLSASDLALVDSGDVTQVGNLKIRFIHTPGHTPGSQCFLVENQLLSGDTLFIGSCGRVDLPGSDPEQMYYSLSRLRNLPDETVVFPGHAYAPEPNSTIGREKRKNPYMNFPSVREFLAAMGYARG